ncbi:efflux transporter outer membrane subunit (plasmid) [Massilia varians]
MMLKIHTTRLALALAASLLAGCSLAPVYQQPAAPLPAAWPGAGTVAGAPATAATLDWEMFVGDAGLRALIGQALDNNRDLRQALLNVQAARAQYRIERAERLPAIDLQAGGTRQRIPADTSATGQSQLQSSWQAGVGLAAFELDLFGRVASLSEAALQEYLATESAARAARIALVGEVIEAYLVRHGAQQRRLLVEQTLASREASLRLVAERRAMGVGSALDYQEAVGLREQARAELERTEREIRQAGNALGLLVGDSGIHARLPAVPGDGAMLVQELAPGLPSDLLAQRPDIQAAEQRLRARNADIGAARAAFFPRISLTGSFGSSSADLSDLFGSGQRAWSFAPQVSLPIFAGGRNAANLDVARVRKDIAVAGYEQAIQAAFREVADALAATDTLLREEQAQAGLARSTAEAMRLSEARYRAGIDGHLRYLDAQRSAFASQAALIQVTTQRQLALATLFRTLGGGWAPAEHGPG